MDRHLRRHFSWIRGLVIGSVAFDAECHEWWFAFDSHGGLKVACPWRIQSQGKVALASGDHQQKYGLPAPIDAAAEATELLSGCAVEDLTVDGVSGDVRVRLNSAAEIHTFGDSRGYEMWQLVSPDDQMFVGQGGRAFRVRWEGRVGYNEPLNLKG